MNAKAGKLRPVSARAFGFVIPHVVENNALMNLSATPKTGGFSLNFSLG
jgi:hypothetical protein